MAKLQQRAERFPLPLPLRYRIATATEWFTARTQNISGSGILFVTDREIAVGTEIELELAMEAGDERWPSELVARALVVRVASHSGLSAPTALAAKFVEHQLLPRHVGQA